MPANIPAKKRFTKSRTVAGFMLRFSFHFHLVVNWIKSGFAIHTTTPSFSLSSRTTGCLSIGVEMLLFQVPVRGMFILSFIAQALGGWALRGEIGESALHAVFSTSFHVAAVDDDS